MVTSERPSARAVLQSYLAGITCPGGTVRTLAESHWGLPLEAGGWPLEVGVAIRQGVLRAQAEVLHSGIVDPHELLHRNRRLRLVRYTHADDGTVWVEGDLPEESVTARLADRMLGSLVTAAIDLRARAIDLQTRG